MYNNHSNPAGKAAIELTALNAIAVGVIAGAHARGLERVREAREARQTHDWAHSLNRARQSSSAALDVARAAVKRVQDQEKEIAALRKAVASRDALIKNFAAGNA
jgi:hypothetical protein